MTSPPQQHVSTAQLSTPSTLSFHVFFFPSQIRCANPTHVRMVARVSGLEMTLTASALQGTEEVFAMLVNTTLLSRGLIL